MQSIHIKTAIGELIIKEGQLSEYKKLAHLHYRSASPGAVDRIFCLYGLGKTFIDARIEPVGLIVYSLPPINCRLRNVATKGRYLLDDTKSRITLLNEEMRTISRVIIHPVFRGLGLASSLVRRTLPLAGTRFVEASAVMGRYHPFFEKAGMRRFEGPMDMKKSLLKAAFEYLGIEEEDLILLDRAVEKINNLTERERTFLWESIDRYYISARKANYSSKIKYDLGWLLPRIQIFIFSDPVYYLWEKTDGG